MIPRDEEHRPRSPRIRRPLAGAEMPARSTSPLACEPAGTRNRDTLFPSYLPGQNSPGGQGRKRARYCQELWIGSDQAAPSEPPSPSRRAPAAGHRRTARRIAPEEQVRPVQPAPPPLRHVQQLERHQQALAARTRPLRYTLTQPHRRERRFDQTPRRGRTPEGPARECESSVQVIRTWVAQAGRDAGERTDGLRTGKREEATSAAVTRRARTMAAIPGRVARTTAFIGFRVVRAPSS